VAKLNISFAEAKGMGKAGLTIKILWGFSLRLWINSALNLFNSFQISKIPLVHSKDTTLKPC